MNNVLLWRIFASVLAAAEKAIPRFAILVQKASKPIVHSPELATVKTNLERRGRLGLRCISTNRL